MRSSRFAIGKYTGDDWMRLVRPFITEKMGLYEVEDIQFGLLALCRSPLASFPEAIAENLKTVLTIEEILDERQPDWRDFSSDEVKLLEEGMVRGPDSHYRISQGLLDNIKIPVT